MTTDFVRDAFEQLNDAPLLATAAVFADEYATDAQRVLKEVAESHGILEANIRGHRESCYPGIEFEFRCETCNCKLLINRDSFVDGEYNCPNCNSCNPVHYMEIEAPPSDWEHFKEFCLAGGLFGEFRDAGKRRARRKGILDGTYWKKLKEMRRPPTASGG